MIIILILTWVVYDFGRRVSRIVEDVWSMVTYKQ